MTLRARKRPQDGRSHGVAGADPVRPFRQPRQKSPTYLRLLRQLPCVGCGIDPCGEAAHIRAGSIEHGKRETGRGEKPSDRYAIPLCGICHRDGPSALHKIGEEAFFVLAGLGGGGVFDLCERLWRAKGRPPAMRRIVMDIRNGLA